MEPRFEPDRRIPGGPGGPGGGEHEKYLAEALGITEDKLKEALAAAMKAERAARKHP